MFELSELSGYSLRELLMLGLDAATMVIEAREKGHVIIEATPEGRALTEYSFPEPLAVSTAIQDLLEDPCSLSLQRAIADLDPDNSSVPRRPDSD
jgi:hypothetical protein